MPEEVSEAHKKHQFSQRKLKEYRKFVQQIRQCYGTTYSEAQTMLNTALHPFGLLTSESWFITKGESETLNPAVSNIVQGILSSRDRK